MQVEDLTVALRKRSNWEAIDLGFALARCWFLRLWCAWLIGALPVFIITTILLITINHNVIGPLVFILFWWFKPLYEQPLLYILSRQLFSETVTLRDIFKKYFIIIKPQLVALLLWRRFSLSRSFNNPVAMLEGLRGKVRRARINILHAHQSSASQWLTIVCIHLEVLLNLAFITFLYMLLPTEFNELTLLELLESEGVILTIINNIVYLVAISVIAPFYVAAGFSLYITRRTKLEGWDIELAFKRMRNRLENKKYVLNNTSSAVLISFFFIVCIIFTTLLPSTSYANYSQEPSKEIAKATIEKVLKIDHFGKSTKKKTWVYIGNDKQGSDKLPRWLEKFFKWLFGDYFDGKKGGGLQILEIVIWLTVAVVIIWLFKKYSNWMRWINTQPSSKNKNSPAIPNKIMGLEITQDSLPIDILASFTELIQNKHYREALSLLYRASLSAVVQQDGINIPASATEQECSRIVNLNRGTDEANYFLSLTQAWIMLAYGNQIPTEETLTMLREKWPEFYGKIA